MVDLCLGCASEPQVKEKSQDLYRTPCCSRFICSRCIQSRRRLTEWCIFCSKAIDAVKAPDQPEIEKETAPQFVIDDEDDDDEEEDGKKKQRSTDTEVHTDLDRDALPPYAPPQASSSSNNGGVPAPQQPSSSTSPPFRSKSHPTLEREATNMHYIQASETLQGIAFSYGVKPSQLVALNKLPLTILSTQPTLLHTRSFLILPAGVQSRAPDPHDPPDVAYYKSVLRRFQMSSKCADPSVAEVYVKAAFDKKKQELEFVNANREARGLPSVSSASAVEQTVPEQGGELENALEAFRLDEKWEREHPPVGSGGKSSSKGKGKWTGLTAGLLKGKG